MNGSKLIVSVEMVDGDVGETVTERVVIRPREGDDKVELLNTEANNAVKEATKKMLGRYGGLNE